MPRTSFDPKKAGWSLAMSLAAHAAILSCAFVLAYRLAQRDARSSASRAAGEGTIPIELPGFSEGSLASNAVTIPEGAPPEAHGGATVARVDTSRAGRAGQARGERATNLADANERARFNPDLRSHLERDQTQRLRTARVRQAWEDRRATTHPMELTFLASGEGTRPERRPRAPDDPSRGSLLAPRAAVLGGSPGAEAQAPGPGDPSARAGSSREGREIASPGLGVRDGEPGRDHRASSTIAHARPSVTEGYVTIPAARDGRPNDTVDSDQEVASVVRSLVHASVAGALARGRGQGGSEAPGVDPGAGGARGSGSVARPLGAGDGLVFDWYTSDPLLLPYFRKIHAKVDPLWANAFPKSAMLELKQGTVILEFSIAKDGRATVSWPPARPSGIDEFDRNCAAAIRRASPFEPIPRALLDRGYASLRIRAPFVAKNPIIK